MIKISGPCAYFLSQKRYLHEKFGASDMQGFLDFLCGNIWVLDDSFCIKIVVYI